MLIFDFSIKGLGVVSPSRFGLWFFRKMFLKLHCFNRLNFITWLPLLLQMLVNMCIVSASFSDFNALNFEIKLIFLIKPFFYMTNTKVQRSWEPKEILGEIKSIFNYIKRTFSCYILSRTERSSLTFWILR